MAQKYERYIEMRATVHRSMQGTLKLGLDCTEICKGYWKKAYATQMYARDIEMRARQHRSVQEKLK